MAIQTIQRVQRLRFITNNVVYQNALNEIIDEDCDDSNDTDGEYMLIIQKIQLFKSFLQQKWPPSRTFKRKCIRWNGL